MWKSFKDLPTLTELFFGKGVDPATYKGEDKTPAYLSGKGKTKAKAVNKPKKKPITEVTKATSKTAEKPRGTRKDYSLQTKLKKSLKE
tara:strand:+ start:2950 stop:3213 length:264 start_codon:yes stop_codon:yes gene_type:complete